MSESKVVGGKGKRRDPVSVAVITNWQTDIIDNRDPDYVYEFPLESQLGARLRPTRIQLFNYSTGESEIHDIPAWQVCHRETGPEELAGFRPDEGKPVDTVLRHGPHVAVRIHRKHWEILQRVQEQRADSYDQRLNNKAQHEFDINGSSTNVGTGAKVTPGHIRMTTEPLARV